MTDRIKEIVTREMSKVSGHLLADHVERIARLCVEAEKQAMLEQSGTYVMLLREDVLQLRQDREALLTACKQAIKELACNGYCIKVWHPYKKHAPECMWDVREGLEEAISPFLEKMP